LLSTGAIFSTRIVVREERQWLTDYDQPNVSVSESAMKRFRLLPVELRAAEINNYSKSTESSFILGRKILKLSQ
jgi:hypothetical protein